MRKTEKKLNFCSRCGSVITDKRRSICDVCEIRVIDNIMNDGGKIFIQKCRACSKVNHYLSKEYNGVARTKCKLCDSILKV